MAATAGIVLAALLYTFTFSEALDSGYYENTKGFTTIMVPDTVLYRNLLGEAKEYEVIGIVFAVKNALGPISLWYIAGSDFYAMAAINGFFIFLSLIYFSRLSQHFRVELSTKSAVTMYIGLAPILVYYSIGALKELPCLLGFLGFFYHYIKSHTKSWLFFVLVLAFFRFQLIFPVFVFVVLDKVLSKAFKPSVVVLLAVACIFPFLKSYLLFYGETADTFRAEQLGTIGGDIEYIRETIPLLSSIAVAIRIVQSLLEPILTTIRYPSFVDADGFFLIYRAINVFENVILAPYWILAGVKMFRELFTHAPAGRDVNRLYTLIVLYVVPVAGFSFIHHRYLLPMTGLVFIASMIVSGRRKAFRVPVRVASSVPDQVVVT